MQRSVETVVPANMFNPQCMEPLVVLRELFELLQDYAPIWYTEELHTRTAVVLGELEPSIS